MLVVSVVVLVSVGGRGGVYCYAAVRSSSKYARRMRGECGSFLVASLCACCRRLVRPAAFCFLHSFLCVFFCALCRALCLSIARGSWGPWVVGLRSEVDICGAQCVVLLLARAHARACGWWVVPDDVASVFGVS